jgi:hypothetical protein
MRALLMMEAAHPAVKGTEDEMDSLFENAGVVVNLRLFRDGTVQVGDGVIACSL